VLTELIVWERDGRVEKVRVPDEGLTIGRKPTPYGASYCTPNSAVSRLHCRLARLGDGWYLEDLGSANGTILNGELADGPTPVRPGDIILLGPPDHGVRAQLVEIQPPTRPKGTPPPMPLPAPDTIDDEELTNFAQWSPLDRIRSSYDVVAERYASDLSDPNVQRPLERGMLLAFSDLVRAVGPGVVGDVGCGPGHISKHLAELGLTVVGYDVSLAMIELARKRHPTGQFHVASMLELPIAAGAWIGAVAMLATLHCDTAERARTLEELHRVVRAGGWVLHSFFVSAPDQPPGSTYRLEKWFDYKVELDTYFVGIDDAAAEMDAAGFEVMAALVREPMSPTELPARRCYMLGKRR